MRSLGTGDLPLTHEAFQVHPDWRPAAHLRELLMDCGILPAIDKHVLLFERWLAEHLASISNTDDARAVRQFATWHVLQRLRTKAKRTAVGPNARRHAGGQVIHATTFLAWLRARDRTLSGCTQADLDAWQAGRSTHAKQALGGFLRWCTQTGHMSHLEIPPVKPAGAAPITQHQRLAVLRRLLGDTDTPLRTRVAGILLLLYAQPVTRVVRLTIDDVIRNDSEVSLRVGEPPSPVPEPFAALLLQLVAERTNMRTATNADTRWLFPGRRAGQPLHPDTLSTLLRQAGVPTIRGRTASIRQLVLQAPAPVVADALGYHATTAHRHVAEAGETWSRYAAGDHPQSPTLPKQQGIDDR